MELIITADFLAFDIDTSRINPDFLVLITTTKKVAIAQSASSGTTGDKESMNCTPDTKSLT